MNNYPANGNNNPNSQYGQTNQGHLSNQNQMNYNNNIGHNPNQNMYGMTHQTQPQINRSFDSIYQHMAQSIEPQSNTPHYNTLQLTTNGVCKKFIHGKCRQADSCKYPHDKSKIKPCNKFQMNGTCAYGEKCNFSHDLKICPDFMKEKCDRGDHCTFRHVYKSCPNFEMGFCFLGRFCKLKHIVKKLCWDYMYGYCEKGSRCPDHHPKIFVDQDFQQTKILFSYLSKQMPEKYVCHTCGVIGHKVNKCPKRVEIQPNGVFKCGLCGGCHQHIDDCNYIP